MLVAARCIRSYIHGCVVYLYFTHRHPHSFDVAPWQNRTPTHSYDFGDEVGIRRYVVGTVAVSLRSYDDVHLGHIVTANQRQCMLTG